jgi:hypothetical protein
MSLQTGSIDKNGLARTEDGKLYVTSVGTASITGGSGVPILLAQSFAAASGAADTNENTLATVTVPANTLGANGSLRIVTYWSFTNNANNKTCRVRFSGAAGTTYYTQTYTTQLVATAEVFIGNRNATNSQAGWFRQSNGAGSTSISTLSTSAVDTTAATTLLITGQKATGTDALTLEGYIVEYIKPTA